MILALAYLITSPVFLTVAFVALVFGAGKRKR